MPDLSFDQTCDSVSLVALAATESRNLALDMACESVSLSTTAAGDRQLALTQTCDPTTVSSTASLGRAIRATNATAEAKLVSHVTLGEAPFPPRELPKLYNLTGAVRQTGGAIICFVGPPWKTIQWRMVKGHGTLTPYTTFTDALGRCSCRYDAGGLVESVIIGAAYVP